MIAGGGTGGHLFPALALADEIKRQRPEARLYYIGSKFGLEKEILPRKEIPFTLLPIRGLQRNMDLQGFGRNLLLPGRLLNSLVKVKRIFSSFNPDVVVGTGGYASALPLHVGIRREIPTLIQEQNSYPGITTRWFGSKVNRICIAFEEATRYFQKKNYYLTGNPVRNHINKGHRKDGLKRFQLQENRKTVFLFGGSQGSAFLNQTLESIVPKLIARNLQVLWQTGQRSFASFQKHDQEFCRVVPFIQEMELAYACCDLVLSRAGALTLSEITACGKPSILVPFPGAAGNHQEKNSLALQQSGAAEMILESDLTPDKLYTKVTALFSDENKLKMMAQASARLSRPKATQEIVHHIFELATA